MTAAIDGIKQLVIPDTADWFVNGQPSDALVHMVNDINSFIGKVADYQAPVIPDPPDPPVATLIQTNTSVSGTQTFTGLDGYQWVELSYSAVTQSSNGLLTIEVTTDNGTNWKTASGDYYGIAQTDGTKTDYTAIQLQTLTNTGPSYGSVRIETFSLAARKRVVGPLQNFFVATTTALNGVRLKSSTGINGGTVRLIGLPGLS